MHIDVQQQKQVLYAQLKTLHELEACEVLFGSLDPEFLEKKKAELEWNYKTQIQENTVALLNKDNCRVYQPSTTN